MQELIDKLISELGPHFEIDVFPRGGIIHISSCEECETQLSESEVWDTNGPNCKSIDNAVALLKAKIADKSKR